MFRWSRQRPKLSKAQFGREAHRAALRDGASLIGQSVQTVLQWLLDIALSKAQVVKATIRCPVLLGCSIEDNMNPTFQWLLNTRLTKAQVATVIAHCPQILGLSIEPRSSCEGSSKASRMVHPEYPELQH